MLGAILKDLATFMDKKPISTEVPDESSVVDLTEYGLGTVQVVYSKGVLTVTKLT
jgi:hypothetical protein